MNSVRPKFLDFKIYANDDHHTNGYSRNLLPYSSASVATSVIEAVAGEWEPSKMIIPTGSAGGQGNVANREIIAVGPNYPGNGASGLDAVSLVEGYAASRGLPNILDPNTPTDADDVDGFNPDNWIAATFNDGTEQTQDVLADMITENNLAPYPFENDGTNTDTQYPGGANNLPTMQIHDQEFITTTTIGGTTRLKGGNFPCGLIAISTFGLAIGDSLSIQVNLVPGTHRGYLCEPMTEM